MRVRPDGEDADDTSERLNTEQQDEDQAQDVAEDALYGSSDHDPLDSAKAAGDRTQVMPDDAPDLVDKMNEMLRSGRIDTGAFAGEPDLDDEESLLGGEGDADIDADDEDPLDGVADTGDDPLGAVASDHGLEGETEDEDADPAEIDIEEDE